jgi:hypothetical protein
MDELLVRRATQRLTAREQAELDSLLATARASDAEGYERAAAAIHVGALGNAGELPAALRARIERQALRYLTERARTSRDDNGAPP